MTESENPLTTRFLRGLLIRRGLLISSPHNAPCANSKPKMPMGE